MAEKQGEQLAKIQRELALMNKSWKAKRSPNEFRKKELSRSSSFSDWTDTGSFISRLTEHPQVKTEPSSDEEPSNAKTPTAASKAWIGLGPRRKRLPTPNQQPHPSLIRSQVSTITKCCSGMKRKADATDLQPPSTDILLKKSLDDLFCEFCRVSCSSESTLNDHLKGRKHKANLKWSREKWNSIVGEKGRPRCDVCQICCPDGVALGMHVKGKKHRAKLQESQNGGVDDKKPIRCELCLVSCMNEEAFLMHLVGRQHVVRAEMARRRLI